VTEKRALEIDEDMAFQRREWVAQRLGVVLLFVFVLGALLGVTGMGGPLSHRVAGEPDGPVQIEYDRFVRRGGIAKIKVRLNGISGEPRLWISSAYLDHVHIQSINPRPDSVSIENDRHMYTIPTKSPRATITLEVEHETFGTVEGEIGLVGSSSFPFSQFAVF
jgi:hypothetical protein